MADSHVCSWQARLAKSPPATRMPGKWNLGVFFPLALIYMMPTAQDTR